MIDKVVMHKNEAVVQIIMNSELIKSELVKIRECDAVQFDRSMFQRNLLSPSAVQQTLIT